MSVVEHEQKAYPVPVPVSKRGLGTTAPHGFQVIGIGDDEQIASAVQLRKLRAARDVILSYMRGFDPACTVAQIRRMASHIDIDIGGFPGEALIWQHPAVATSFPEVQPARTKDNCLFSLRRPGVVLTPRQRVVDQQRDGLLAMIRAAGWAGVPIKKITEYSAQWLDVPPTTLLVDLNSLLLCDEVVANDSFTTLHHADITIGMYDALARTTALRDNIIRAITSRRNEIFRARLVASASVAMANIMDTNSALEQMVNAIAADVTEVTVGTVKVIVEPGEDPPSVCVEPLEGSICDLPGSLLDGMY